MTKWNEDLIPISHAGTLDGLFRERVQRSPERVAYRHYDRNSSEWKDHSWQQMAHQTSLWQQSLQSEHLHRGDRVAVQLRNCPEWVCFDQAALGLGLVNVPLYTDDRPDNVAYILHDSDARLLLVQDAGRWKKIAASLPQDSPLKGVIVVDPGKDGEALLKADSRVRLLSDWLASEPKPLHKRKSDPHALASIVYTSGTTGRSKGVMLSHYNMLSVAHAGITMIDVFQQDTFLSFLPLSHTLERTVGYYLPIITGSTVAFSRSVAQLANDLQIIHPSVMVAVPRIFERVYGRLQDQLKKKGKLSASLFQMAIKIGWLRFQVDQGRASWQPALLLWPLLRKLVASKISEKLGGKLRLAISGGAALSPEIARVFLGLGIPLLQGYGLTETSPIISVNLMHDNEPSSVGVPLRGIQARIGENDELLVKTPGMMLGYWNNHAATRQMIDDEGWLHTGDQARIENEHIYITGRLKDILVLSNGEKVPPSDMELAIALDPLIEQVMIVGEGQPFMSALVVLNADLWPGFAQDLGLDPMAAESLQNDKMKSRLLRRISAQLKDFPGYAKVRRVSVFLQPWTVENGTLTPTMKVKRPQVIRKHQKDIDAMYR
ncbi:MAG: AMP-dependent synthetase/ligase [gamma proteobacterium symbiont of Bathyaustriella thionipta]|nr:AMP-dependent synthetase/ligase [gamma proteobacterium symbiont of Bathyaustriella thionipta]